MLTHIEHLFIHLYRKIVPVKRILYQHEPIPLTLPPHYPYTQVPQQTDLPVVSIVTPSYNQGRFIERTIQSVLSQNYPYLEYVVQDGGSDDETLVILDEYENQCKIVSRPDKGQAHAINLGFQQTIGEIMAWLNADDMLLPGAVSYVVNFFLNHPEVDVLYSHRISVDEWDQEVGRLILPNHDNQILFWSDYLPQETLFWRRSLWDNVGSCLNETYQFALDWELLIRFQSAGANFVRLPRFLGAFRVHDDQKTLALNQLGHHEMARLRKNHHNRSISWREAKRHSLPYLIRLVGFNLLYRGGLLRY